MDSKDQFISASAIASQVNSGEKSAEAVVSTTLARTTTINPKLNAFTSILSERASNRALYIDKEIAAGKPVGPLAGVPFAVKNLFDVRGEITLAGSKINQNNTAANTDAVLIQKLESAGAILIGSLNMGEYAYDFTGENCHYGNCHNPWRANTMSGGSSSGSGSATAAGLVPIALGSDTNGSIRVPASLCGIFGLKPTYGRLSRRGTYPFVDSLDHLGPLARSVEDLALSFDVMQGYDASDHACAKRNTINTSQNLNTGIDDLKIAKLEGYFDTSEYEAANNAVEAVCKTLGTHTQASIDLAEAGRAAAYLITNTEGASLHLPRLQQHADHFDPDTRDRFAAGTMLPAHWYIKAQQVRKHYLAEALKLFKNIDILIAPATPTPAPMMGEKWLTIGDTRVPLRPNLGYFAQPISAIGLPSVVVPSFDEASQLPIGVQIIAKPWREDLCLRVAHYLEHKGFSTKIPTAISAGDFSR